MVAGLFDLTLACLAKADWTMYRKMALLRKHFPKEYTVIPVSARFAVSLFLEEKRGGR